MSLVERAYQLAAQCPDLKSVRATLQKEGYIAIDAHLSSPTLRKDLLRLIASSVPS